MAANSIAIAGGAVAVALFETLVERNVIEVTDARLLLEKAQANLDRLMSGAGRSDAVGAAKILDDMYAVLPQGDV